MVRPMVTNNVQIHCAEKTFAYQNILYIYVLVVIPIARPRAMQMQFRIPMRRTWKR